jgi:hypothetical protein
VEDVEGVSFVGSSRVVCGAVEEDEDAACERRSANSRRDSSRDSARGKVVSKTSLGFETRQSKLPRARCRRN